MFFVKEVGAALALLVALSTAASAQEGLLATAPVLDWREGGLGGWPQGYGSVDLGGVSMGGASMGRAPLWTPDASGDWSLGIARTQWVETRLPLFPKNLVEGNLRPRESFATTLTVGKPIGSLSIAPGAWWGVSGIGVEAEGTLSVHDGLQDHVEGTAGVMLRSPKATWNGVGDFGVGWANGLSYAFTDPAYERGPSGTRGLDTERIQYYMGFEATFSPEAAPNIELFGRLHHRSGIYGVISPDSTGSNMLGGGVRLNF